MKFSQSDAIEKERELLAIKKDNLEAGIVGKLVNFIMDKRKPKHTFSFYVPQNIYMRANVFCGIISDITKRRFWPGDLAQVLFIDFLEYYQKDHSLHDVHKLLLTRDVRPAMIRPYTTDSVHRGVVFEEVRGFELVTTDIAHKYALRGEILLQDMAEIYKDKTFTLEHTLEIVFNDFIENYRKGAIKNPTRKIMQYIV